MNEPLADVIQNLDPRRIMLSFSYLAYCGERITAANPEQTILQYINEAIPKIPPLNPQKDTWKVVWGPVTYTLPGALYQENLMFVAQNQKATDQFVVAIRGTNSIADIDWLVEDLDILDMMNWPPGTAPSQEGPRISEGTSIGLQLLLQMQDKLAEGTQPTLLEFLKTQTNKPIQLCVTGHSLGGCLAGTLALYLKENPALWDASNKSGVSCITFAAPTAGNAEFAKRSDEKFKGDCAWPDWEQPLGTSCDTVRCDLDVAPMAWIADNLIPPNGTESPLFQKYKPDLVPVESMGFGSFSAWSGLLTLVFPYVASKVSEYDYQQVESQAVPIPGSFHGKPDTSQDLTLLQFLERFMAEATYQHAKSYPEILGVPELNNEKIIKVE